MSLDSKTQSLFEAIATANYDVVKRLLDLGVSLDRVNERGLTPLAFACRHGNLEIVDLLIAAGAQMYSVRAKADASGAPTSVLPTASSDSVESPVRDRDISFEDLIDSIERSHGKEPTQIDRPLAMRTDSKPLKADSIAASDSEESPVRNPSISFEDLIDSIEQPIDLDRSAPEIENIIEPIEPVRPTTSNRNSAIHQAVANLQDLNPADPDAEQTYTFDLDAVFIATESSANTANPNASPDLFDEEDRTMTSLDRPIAMTQIEAGETYAFDLTPDLDRLSVETLDEEPDRLAVPMGQWEETETYMLENIAALTSQADGSGEIDILFDPDGSFSTHPGLEEGETYIVDLPSVQSSAPIEEGETYMVDLPLLQSSAPIEEGETYMVDLPPLQSSAPIEDGETYVVDLDPSFQVGKLNAPSERLRERDLAADSSLELFPTEEEEEPYFDPDTQTSTDIFGHNGSKLEADDDRVSTYDDNATNTSLMAATIDGDLDLVNQAIEAGAHLDRYDWNLGYSPLGMAIDRGHVEIVQSLLNAGANPHCGNTSTTALGLAAERGEVEIVQMLLPRGVDVNAPVGRDGWTALMSAIKNGHRSVVQLLVTAGANVNVWSQGETPILLAAKSEDREIYNYLYPLVNTTIRLCADRDGEHLLQASRKRRIREQNRPVEKFIEMATIGNLEEIKRAIAVGIEVDELGSGGHTALMAAAYYGHRSVVNALLEAGADPNLLSDDDGLGASGMTALMLAAGSYFASNRHQIAQVLIDRGADVNQRGIGGKTAIFYAALAGSGYRECVEKLIAAGADLDIADDRGHTVLSSTAAVENYPMFNLLMQAGASTTGLESVQLIQAATTGNVDRVKSLLSAKVNLDLDRGAALGNAAAAGHTEVVELLIRAGANVNLRDKLGFTPIASAAYAGYGEIVRLLIDAGADTQAPADSDRSYSVLEYAQMGMYQFDREDLQHAQIVQMLQELN